MAREPRGYTFRVMALVLIVFGIVAFIAIPGATRSAPKPVACGGPGQISCLDVKSGGGFLSAQTCHMFDAVGFCAWRFWIRAFVLAFAVILGVILVVLAREEPAGTPEGSKDGDT